MSLSLLAELKRRRVFRALVGYGIAAFAVLQIIEPIMHGLHWPDAVLSYVVVALALGFPVVVSLAWIFDVNAGRIERTAPPSTAGGLRGARLALLLVGIGLLAAVPGVVWYFFVRGVAKPAATATSAEASSQPPSIAVLPFVNLSSDKEQEYFSDGLAEELLNALAHVPGLRVAARTSAFQFKGKSLDVREVASRLGVAYLVEGSVRKSGNRLRVTAQLVQATDGYHLWSEMYDRELRDAFAVQDDLSRSIVKALALHLAPGRTSHVPLSEAHDAYLRALFFFNKGTKVSFEKALRYYREAVELDPLYAAPWAGIAETEVWLADAYLAPGATYPLAKEAALKAIQLDPNLPEGHLMLGAVLLFYDWKFTASDEEFRKAKSLGSGYDANFHFYYAHQLAIARSSSEGLAEARKALELDPLSSKTNSMAAWFLFWDRQWKAALAQQAHADELSTGSLYLGSVAGDAYRELRLFDHAVQSYLEEEKELRRPSHGLAVTYARMGRVEEARAIAERLEEFFRTQYVAPERIAAAWVAVGDKDRGFAWLEKGLEIHDGFLPLIRIQPEFDSIRSEPRYTAILRRIGWAP